MSLIVFNSSTMDLPIGALRHPKSIIRKFEIKTIREVVVINYTTLTIIITLKDSNNKIMTSYSPVKFLSIEIRKSVFNSLKQQIPIISNDIIMNYSQEYFYFLTP